MFAKWTFFVNFVAAKQQINAIISLKRRIMSKTIEIQIEKSRNLIEGLRRHVKEQGEKGIATSEINEMEQVLKQLADANAEVDRLREELSPKVKKMNEILANVKTSYGDAKKSLKGFYPQERWQDYGISDKR